MPDRRTTRFRPPDHRAGWAAAGGWRLGLVLTRMSRPDHLLLIVVVDLWGVAVAIDRGAMWDLRAAMVGIGAMLVVATSIHLANEWADQDTDALATRTPFSGGSGALVAMTGSPRGVGVALVSSMVAAVVAPTGLVLAGELAGGAAAVLVVAALAGWAYSLPPLAWSRRGWGELDNALLGGMVLPVYGAATVGSIDPAVVLAAGPFTLLVFANLLATQWPDRWADAAVGSWGLATRWSPARLRAVHATCIVLAFVVVAALPDTVVPDPVVPAVLVALPVAGWAVATFTTDDRPLPTVATMVVFVAADLFARSVEAIPWIHGS